MPLPSYGRTSPDHLLRGGIVSLRPLNVETGSLLLPIKKGLRTFETLKTVVPIGWSDKARLSKEFVTWLARADFPLLERLNYGVNGVGCDDGAHGDFLSWPVRTLLWLMPMWMIKRYTRDLGNSHIATNSCQADGERFL
jgi:hypothetical protein